MREEKEGEGKQKAGCWVDSWRKGVLGACWGTCRSVGVISSTGARIFTIRHIFASVLAAYKAANSTPSCNIDH